MFKNIKIVGFDADDTLWVNEPFFKEIEEEFCDLLVDFLPNHKISKELFKTEVQNLELYGYGVKAFLLSLIETALKISNYKVSNHTIARIIELGKEQLKKPVILLDGIEDVLKELSENYKLIVATKGDLLDQERKLSKSGIEEYFHHIEIMSDKKESDYTKLLNHLEIKPEEFVMIGNSLKSDIIPVINIGGQGIHIPFHTTWQHETQLENDLNNKDYHTLESVSDSLKLFSK
ncbi:MAG: HAD family hydrolase [Marinilabiliales bacterium]|nr:MAG: HAD family hydrolase [Marinilabiliales bacterium]